MTKQQKEQAEIFPPGEFIKDELEVRGWSQADLAEIIGKTPRLVSEIITGKRSITPESARALGEAFGTSAELWLNLESQFKLSRVNPLDSSVSRRAKLFAIAPVSEMVRRGWIQESKDVGELERQVLSFYEIRSIEESPRVLVAARARGSKEQNWTPAQIAWFCRLRQIGDLSVASSFSTEGVESVVANLRPLLREPEEVRHVPRVLADGGIRFVVIEHTAGSRIDGATYWLSPDKPVVAVSLRYDRIDSFWYTLFHELGHVARGDGRGGLDVALVGQDASREGWSEEEHEADRFATTRLVPQEELTDFMARTRPLYSRVKIEAFAARHHLHPGIVLGQIKHADPNNMPWQNLVTLHARVRDTLTASALCDGWGNVLPPLN